MAVVVVDALEVVEIEQRQRERCAALIGARERGLEQHGRAAAIPQMCQRIHERFAARYAELRRQGYMRAGQLIRQQLPLRKRGEVDQRLADPPAPNSRGFKSKTQNVPMQLPCSSTSGWPA